MNDLRTRMERIRAADELACYNALAEVQRAINEWVVLHHKGTQDLKEHLTRMTTRMRKELQLGITEGGRDGFNAKLKNWTGFVLFDDFMVRLDRLLTRMPAPRQRRNAPGTGPRGANVYNYRVRG